MDVKNKKDGKRGVFYIEGDNKEIALMHYIFAGPTKMIIDRRSMRHMEVKAWESSW